MKKRALTNNLIVRSSSLSPHKTAGKLFDDIRALIESARERVAHAVNTGLITLCWSIGDRIRREVLGEKRAEYGERIVSTVGRQLSVKYGQGYSEKNLRHMVRFVESFPDPRIVSTLSRQLGWSHFKEIIYMEDTLKRDFYAEMCRIERWSVRTLREKIRGMLYERTALSRKPAKLAKLELGKLRAEDRLTPDLVFRGQMALYLHWLEKHERQYGENPPIGLILCAGKDHEEIELLKLDKSGIRVAEYMTELPPRKILEKKLHQAIMAAREHLAIRQQQLR